MPPIHIALRYGRSQTGMQDPVGAHQAVIREEGAVWFGKLGKAIGADTISKINAQAPSEPTYLFLAARAGRELHTHRGAIEQMTSELPSGERALVPEYYDDLGLMPQITTWFRLTELRADNVRTFQRLKVASTGTPLLSVLGSSQRSMFIVALNSR